jgi:hypothetical protein
MTATSLTYLLAREHINDLRREAKRERRAAHVRSSRRFKVSLLHPSPSRDLATRAGLPRTPTKPVEPSN